MLLGLTGILVCTIVRVHEHYHEVETDYGIILDGGSTSTKAYIYEWEHKTAPTLPYVSLSMSYDNIPRKYKTRPGIASITPNTTAIATYLDPIIEWASSIIPKHKMSTTPIFFQGTGGIRMMSETAQGALLTSVRFRLQESGFLFGSSYASVLTGIQQAGYGFMAVNGLYNNFNPEGHDVKIYGSLDMGGASSDIAFISQDHPLSNYTFATEINGTSFIVYAQTIDGLGINEARYTLNASLYLNSTGGGVVDPCAPLGFYENVTCEINGQLRSFLLMGGSDYGACAAQVRGLVRRLTNDMPYPPVGSTTFVVADHYLEVKKFYKLKDNANILELQAKVSSFCGLNYGDAMAHHNNYANEVQNFCFMGNYIVSLLGDYYGLNPTLRHILWKDSVRKMPVTWTLGSVLNVVEQMPADTSDQTKTRLLRFFRTTGGTVTLFISCLLLCLGLVLYILQMRRPSDYVPIR